MSDRFGRGADFDWDAFFEEPTEVTYAEGRLPSRTYVSKSYLMQFGRDQGFPGRYIYRVFDEADMDDDPNWEWTEEVVVTTPRGRKQLKLEVAREAGAIRKLRIEKVPSNGDRSKMERILELDRDQATRLIEMLKALDSIPVEGEKTVHVDDALLQDLFRDPQAIGRLYSRNPERFRRLIQSDADADDVIAFGRRVEVVETMRQWLTDAESFKQAAEQAGGPEKAWQKLLEANPWVLGIGLGGQLFTSWDSDKLEQVVRGNSIAGVGKRTDALLRTSGIVSSMAFAEIKHHNTPLLGGDYRPGCWEPSKDLAGAVVQVQQTVHLAASQIGDYLADEGADGEMLPSGTFLLRPRCFLVVGLAQLTGPSGGVKRDQFRSFELFRRNLYEPEVITFDELLARAEWHVEMAQHSQDEETGDETG